ncbi:DUF2796 domain-containing protein [Vibrio vulnificus]|uniref:zinc uptake protein ZrgA n=1 Tax=Vibrio vulnificus TaxID=672 RepID=UPI000D3EA467|nr:DUF2796 domain-containing protein [Vibrio vulnificus]EGR0786922.1 DUF2796 domain-containing protein [Vibrio vulnificus]EGR0796224.1 DUF2796 domain-containing protein [Vibrio vulnificus]EGR0813272.1 DUF2796 domain-containing protein [Vibrio vulnificus]EGR0825683.1 DUF2796 domain-containing protein [Vibrio vulnificus]EGR0846227.1 DUF2796 domain-containing protein [Vibrio vulnificus]
MLRKTSLAILVGLSFSALASAQEGFRQHDAHVHGQVEFNIAQDGHDLLLEITAPGADVVGFEHAPENTEQENQLKAAVEKLSQADLMVQINEAAKCTIENVSVTHTLGGEEHDDHEHHDNHEHHDDHGHEHDGHGAFTVEYQYHCDNVAALNALETDWFKQFPATQAIQANVLTDKVQSALALSPAHNTVSLK